MIDLIPDPKSDRAVLPLLTAYRESAHLSFPPPPSDLVTGQGRRRARGRLVALSAAAAVAVAALGSAAVLGPWHAPGPDPGQRHSPSPTAPASQAPSASPQASASPTGSGGTTNSGNSNNAGQQTSKRHSPGTVPASAMLTTDDLGSGYRVVNQSAEGDWKYTYVLQVVCGGSAGKTLDPPATSAAGTSSRLIRFESNAGSGRGPIEGVTGYLEGNARQSVTFYRNAFTTCSRFQVGDDVYVFRVLDSGFAGDDSMLVQLTRTSASTGSSDSSLHGFVWSGDLGAEIAFSDSAAVSWAAVVTQRAAARLGAG